MQVKRFSPLIAVAFFFTHLAPALGDAAFKGVAMANTSTTASATYPLLRIVKE